MATIAPHFEAQDSATSARAARLATEKRPRRRNMSAWMTLAALFGLAVLATPFFMGRVYVADDLGEFHLPLRNFYSQQLARGEPFDWIDSLFGGFYLTGEGQLGAYHPLHQALYRLLPLAAAFDLELLTSYPLMFAGMVLFLRRWLRRTDAAMFGALAFTFCGFNLLHFVHPNAVAIVAHIPWLLLAIDVVLTSNKPLHGVFAETGIVLLTASELLLGYPQYAWFSLITVTAYATWRAIALRATWSRVSAVFLSMVLGVTIAAVQLLPTTDALADSTRSTPDPDFANTGSLHPLNVVQLVAPYLFQTRVVGQNTHELGLYAGAVPIALCVWLLWRRKRWGRLAPLVWASAVFGAAALLFATGEYGGLYGLQSYLPVVNRFRFPCRAIVLVYLSIAILSAVAITILLRARRRGAPGSSSLRNWKKTSTGDTPVPPCDTPLALIVLLSVGLAAIGPSVWGEFVAPWTLVWTGPALIAVAGALIALTERGVRWSVPVLAMFTACDLCSYGMSYSIYGRTADLQEYVAQIPRPPSDPHARIAVVRRDGLRAGDRMLLAGLKRIDGYAGLEPARRLDYSTRPGLQVAAVGWIYQPAASESQLAGQWARVTPTAPRARLVTRAVPTADNRDCAPVLDVVTIQEPLNLPPGVDGRVELTLDRPGRMSLHTTAATRQLLVTTESFHPGWEASVDGQRQPVLPVNRDFLGCVVESGSHHVELAFRPRSLGVGKLISTCGLGLMVCVFCLRIRTRKRITQ